MPRHKAKAKDIVAGFVRLLGSILHKWEDVALCHRSPASYFPAIVASSLGKCKNSRAEKLTLCRPAVAVGWLICIDGLPILWYEASSSLITVRRVAIKSR